MSTPKLIKAIVIAVLWCGSALADDRADYNRRAAERDVALFSALDRNGDGALSRAEAQGDLNLGPRFDDADINRDGSIDRGEIERYIAQRYGVHAAR